jgi:hypothetical protein
MKANKMSNLTKSRKFYLLLCCVMLFSLFVQTRIANSAPPKGIAVRTFTEVDFPHNPQCWAVSVSTFIQYTNSCAVNFIVDVVLTFADKTQESFVMAPSGKLIFIGGSPNVVHIVKENIEVAQ